MQVVLLKNTSRELIPINVGDRGVTVKRMEVVQNKRGQVGMKHTERAVSSSITLMPGVWTRVPGTALKQRAVQRLIDLKVLAVVQQESSGSAPAPAGITIEASAPLKSSKGSHPTREEGTVAVAEVLKKKRAKKRGKETEG